MKITVLDNGQTKHVRSKRYNYDFDYTTGYFARWGETRDDDPQSAPSAEILDIEITTKCNGPGGKLCPFCYKANTPNGHNMSLDTFTKIIDMMKPSKDNVGCTQLAIGADSSCTANPDMWKMMDYARDNNVIPNITVADISDDVADKLVVKCGAVAVSRYEDKNYCYDSVKRLTDRGLDQTNIHMMICQEYLDQAFETLDDYLTDGRLSKLNAIVFLSLKQKGRGVNHTPLTQEQFKSLVDKAFELNVPIGFDSCGANSFMDAIKGRDNEQELLTHVEPCESTLFSSYIDCFGKFYPCSFAPGYDGWDDGIDVLEYDNFKEIWNHPRVDVFRNKLLDCKRNCPMYKIR